MATNIFLLGMKQGVESIKCLALWGLWRDRFSEPCMQETVFNWLIKKMLNKKSSKAKFESVRKTKVKFFYSLKTDIHLHSFTDPPKKQCFAFLAGLKKLRSEINHHFLCSQLYPFKAGNYSRKAVSQFAQDLNSHLRVDIDLHPCCGPCLCI